jgi:hypothetical protein
MSPIDDLYHAVFRSPTRQQTSAGRTRGGISQTNRRPASEVPMGSARPASFYFASHRLKNIRAVSYMSDLGFPDTRRIYEDFEKLMQDLKSDAFKRGATLGVLIIPSKVQIIYAHATNKDLFESEPWMAKLVRDQNKLQKRMTDFFDEQKMKWRSSLPELLDALRRADKEGKLVFPVTSSHPNAIGYKAYAIAAAKLFYDMQGD